MKFKLWVRRMSISAPKMTVKSHFPWPLKAVFLAMALGLGGVMAMWGYDLGRHFTDFNPAVIQQQMKDLSAQISHLTMERDHYATTANEAESKLNIERAMQTQLGNQIKVLESENAKLKQDLAFFEGLLPTAIGDHGIAIQRMSVELISPMQLRYRMLLMQGGKVGRNFSGSLQLLVTAMVNGKHVVLHFPGQGVGEKSSDKANFSLDFKYYQRVEGILNLPEGVVAKSIQAKVLEKGQMRAQQTSNL